jgi:hypothetical protein
MLFDYQLTFLFPESMIVAVPQDRRQDGLDGAAGSRRHELAEDRLGQLTRSFFFRSTQFRRVPHVAGAPGTRLRVHVVQQGGNDLVLGLVVG